jgi:hypothetical protein
VKHWLIFRWQNLFYPGMDIHSTFWLHLCSSGFNTVICLAFLLTFTYLILPSPVRAGTHAIWGLPPRVNTQAITFPRVQRSHLCVPTHWHYCPEAIRESLVTEILMSTYEYSQKKNTVQWVMLKVNRQTLEERLGIAFYTHNTSHLRIPLNHFHKVLM